MLEIILIILMCKRIAASAEDRGLNPILYVIMLIGFWIVAEIIGAVIGMVVAIGIMQANDQLTVLMVATIGGWCGAACGASLAFLVLALHPVPEQRSLTEMERAALKRALRPRRRKRRRLKADDAWCRISR